MKFSTMFKQAAPWAIYPVSWSLLLSLWVAMYFDQLAPQQAWGAMVGTLILSYVVLEQVLPYEKRWSPTWRSIFDDLKYVVVNGTTLASVSAILALYTITISGDLTGPAEDWPIWLQLLSCLFIFEALNYAIHRTMHEGKGKWGRFLWHTHAAHHLPEKLYIFMHVAGHPINAIITQAIVIILPIWAMGYDQMTVTSFLMINSMHGLISHFNVDVRMGLMNYIFIGPETHRYHHSANVSEAKNYGATLSFYDQVFGTFVYKPGIAPNALGVNASEGLPLYRNIFAVLKLPFGR